jgi:type IX secretion system PorP/SprF family membrane protein
MKIILPLFLLILSVPCLGQQDPIYAPYQFNTLLVNPAYAGLNNNLTAMVGYRVQWAGFEGQPKTMYAEVYSSILQNKAGAGLLVVNDRAGNISSTETNLSFSYNLQVEEGILSFGMQAGLQSFRNDYSDLNILDPGDNAFTGKGSGTSINLGAGVALKHEKYFIAFSVPRLLPSTFKNGNEEFQIHDSHYYLSAAYFHYLNDRLAMKPSVMLRGVNGAPPSVDVALSMNFNILHTAGIFTRNFHSYGLMLQTLMKEQYRLGYIFELPTSKSVGSRFTTHEISLGILLSVFDYHENELSHF